MKRRWKWLVIGVLLVLTCALAVLSSVRPGGGSVDRLVVRLESKYQPVSDDALKGLCALNSYDSVRRLAYHLGDEKKPVRDLIRGALVTIGPKAATPIVDEVLSSIGEEPPRQPKPDERPGLVSTFLAADEERAARQGRLLGEAAQTLVAIGPPAIAVVTSYVRAPQSEARRFVLEVMLLEHNPAALGLTCQFLGDPSQEVRRVAALAAQEIARAAEGGIKVTDTTTLPALKAALHSGDRLLVHTALEVLLRLDQWSADFSMFADDETLKVLVTAGKEEEPQSAAFSVLLMERFGGEKAVGYLRELLRCRKIEARFAAARALARRSDAEAVGFLRSALVSEDDSMRAMALEALSSAGIGRPKWGTLVDPAMVTALVSAAELNPPLTRIQAAQALGAIDCEASTKVLLNWVRDRDEGVRVYAAVSLARRANETGIHVLIEVSRSAGEWYHRGIALAALGEVGSPEALEALIRALGDENTSCRGTAALRLCRVLWRVETSDLDRARIIEGLNKVLPSLAGDVSGFVRAEIEAPERRRQLMEAAGELEGLTSTDSEVEPGSTAGEHVEPSEGGKEQR